MTLEQAVSKLKNALRFSGRPSRARKVDLDSCGGEILDSTPMAPPIGFHQQPSMVDIIRDQIHRASLYAEQQGFETEEEADDFDIPDDPLDPSTPYEQHFEPSDEPHPSPDSPPSPGNAPPAPPADGPATPPPAAPKPEA